MANVKITDLSQLTDPTSTDVLPIVDVGADATKKVSIGDLLKNASSGTEGAPGVAFGGDGDADTGIYSPGADQIAVSTGGTEQMRIDSSGRLLVGTSSASQGLSLLVQGSSGSGTSGVVRTAFTGATPAADVALGAFDFSDNGHTPAARIIARRDGGTWTSGASQPTRLEFSTTADSASSPTARMSIDSSGRLLVGTTSAITNLNTSSNDFAPHAQVVGSTLHEGSLAIVRTATSPWLLFGAGTNGTNIAINNAAGSLSFTGYHTDKYYQAAQISCLIDGTPSANDMPGRLVFSTTADGASSPTERMSIDSSGNVGIGITNPLLNLQINSATNANATIAYSEGGVLKWYTRHNAFSDSFDIVDIPNTSTRLSIDTSGRLTAGSATSTAGSTLIENWYTDENRLNVIGSQQSSGATSICYAVRPKSGSVGYVSSADNAAFRRAAIEVGTDSSRHISFKYAPSATVAIGDNVSLTTIASFTSQGLAFGSDTASQNSLDDYEEGTWTPVLTDGTYDATTSVGIGHYTKVGNLVTIHCYMVTSSLGSVTGNLRIKGFPYTVQNGTYSTVSAGYATNLNITAGYTVGVYPYSASSFCYLYLWSSTVGTAPMHSTHWTNTGRLIFSVTYRTA